MVSPVRVGRDRSWRGLEAATRSSSLPTIAHGALGRARDKPAMAFLGSQLRLRYNIRELDHSRDLAVHNLGSSFTNEVITLQAWHRRLRSQNR